MRINTDAFLQHDDLSEADLESVARTLSAFEHLVQDKSDLEMDFVGILDIQQTPVFRSVGLCRNGRFALPSTLSTNHYLLPIH